MSTELFQDFSKYMQSGLPEKEKHTMAISLAQIIFHNLTNPQEPQIFSVTDPHLVLVVDVLITFSEHDLASKIVIEFTKKLPSTQDWNIFQRLYLTTLKTIPIASHKYLKYQGDVLNNIIKFSNEIIQTRIDNFTWVLTQLQTIMGQASKNEDFDTEAKILLLTLIKTIDRNPEHNFSIINIPELSFLLIDIFVLGLQQLRNISNDLEYAISNFIADLIWSPLNYIKITSNDTSSLNIINKKWNSFTPVLKIKLASELLTRIIAVLLNPSDPKYLNKQRYIDFILNIYVNWATDPVLTKNADILQLWYKLGQILITPEFFLTKTKDQRSKVLSLSKSLALSQRGTNQTMELLGLTIKALLADKEGQIDAQLMHTEIVATFNDTGTLTRYLEVLLRVIDINEDNAVSLLYIMNVSLEALQKLGTLKTFKGLREKTKVLVNFIFKSDFLSLKDPISEEQIITFFKNLSQIEEESIPLGEDLATLFQDLITSSKIDTFNYWLHKLIRIFKGHAVSIIVLHQLTHPITANSVNTSKNQNGNHAFDIVLTVREIFINLFTNQREPWYYTNKGPILPAETMVPILKDVLQLFPTSLYKNEESRATYSIVRMHLGRGYQYLQNMPQYLHFLANEYIARLICGDPQFLQPIKQELVSLSFEDQQSFFKTHGDTLWEYLYDPDPSKISFFVLRELLEIYAPYALRSPKGSKEELEHIITIEKLFLRCIKAKNDVSLLILDNICAQILKIYHVNGLNNELPEVLASYVYTVVKIRPIENIDAHIQNSFQTLGLILSTSQLILAKVIWLQKMIISDDSPLLTNFDLCVDILIHHLEALSPHLHTLTEPEDVKNIFANYHQIFDLVSKKPISSIWKDKEPLLLTKIFPIIVTQIKIFNQNSLVTRELLEEYYNAYLALLLTRSSLNKENILQWIEYLYQEDFEFDIKHTLTLNALKKLLLTAYKDVDLYISYGSGLDLLDYVTQHPLYLNRKENIRDLFSAFFQSFSLETIFSLKPLYKDIFKRLNQMLATTNTIKIQDDDIVNITIFFGTMFEYTPEVELLEKIWPQIYDYLTQKPHLLPLVFNILQKYVLKIDPKTETFLIRPIELETLDIPSRIRFVAKICDTWLEYNSRDFLEKKFLVAYYKLLKMYQNHEDSQTNQYIHILTRKFILICYREQIVIQTYYPEVEIWIEELIKDFVTCSLTTQKPRTLNDFRNEIITFYPKIDSLILEKQSQVFLGYQNSSNKVIQSMLQVIEPVIKQYNSSLLDSQQKKPLNEQKNDDIVNIVSKMLWNIYLETAQTSEVHTLEHPTLINETTKQRIEQLIWQNDLFWSELPNVDLKTHAIKSWDPTDPKISEMILSVLEQRGFIQDVIETISEIIKQNPTDFQRYYLFISLLKKFSIENHILMQPALIDVIKKFLAFYKNNNKQNEWKNLGKELIKVLLEHYPTIDSLLASLREEYTDEITQLLHMYVQEILENESWQYTTANTLLRIVEGFGDVFDQDIVDQITKLAVINLVQSLSTGNQVLKSKKDREILEMNRKIYYIWKLNYSFINSNNKSQIFLIQYAKELIAVFNSIDVWINDKYPGNLILPMILGFLNPYYTLEPLKVWKKLETHIRNNIKTLTKIQQDEPLYTEQHEMFEDLVAKLKTFTLDKKIFPAVDTVSLNTFHESLESMLAQYPTKTS